jgi:hypothetical protein
VNGKVAAVEAFAYQRVVNDISNLKWRALIRGELVSVAWAYYYFSIQFRENLEVARTLYPADAMLQQLDRGERNTDNLSPWAGVAVLGEKMNHDEFMRRTLGLEPIEQSGRRRLEATGLTYLTTVRSADETSKALSIASYEEGGLEQVFRAILTAPHWGGPLLRAFKHFLTEHIRFDSDPEQGHGALCRHLTADDRVLPLWTAFRQLLIEAVPALTFARKAGVTTT